jgi:AraC-like DNA-binding protein
LESAALSKPLLIWVEQLVGSREVEVPERLVDAFSVRTVSSFESLDALLRETRPACVFFDFDYPDRRRLERFADVKKNHPSVPVVLMTVQHSESLAVWSYRHGALDYIVKPVPDNELKDCVERILKILELRETQRRRKVNAAQPAMPDDIPNAPRSQVERLAPAVYFVQQNYSQRIYSDAMARLCGMSPTHFSRMFRKTYDLTFQEFLLRYRVRQACRHLCSPTASITDVAYNVGFTDPSYFTRVFKRYLGVAPTDYVAANDGIAAANDSHEVSTSTSQIVRRLTGSFDA